MEKETRSKLLLKKLFLKNFATFEQQTFSFHQGFNAIIGESGSGKSLILEALQYIIGFRADKKSVRKGASHAIVEAFFEFNYLPDDHFFSKMGFPSENKSVVIKRIISKEGHSKCYLNYQNCNLNILQKVAGHYIDLIGQFENQKLLSDKYQLELLDHYAGLGPKNKKYKKTFLKLEKLNKELSELKKQNAVKNQHEDFLKFQISELAQLNPTIEDEKSLIKQKQMIKLKISKSNNIDQAISLLSDNENFNIQGLLKKLNNNLLLGLIDEESQNKLIEFESFIAELSFDLSKASRFCDYEDQLHDIINRLDNYQKLKRKFNCDTLGLINTHHKLQQDLVEISKIDDTIKKMQERIDSLKRKARGMAQEMHRIRCHKAIKFSKILTKGVHALKMSEAKLNFIIQEINALSLTGISKVDFKVETNPGEGMHTLKEVVSGGELSRILLTLRQIVSSSDAISVFVFDEIDSGVGGETALAVGKALKAVSQHSQVIAITHLPQIAVNADNLINIRKEKKITHEGHRTISKGEKVPATEIENILQKMAPLH